jgi:hypothetical protein
MSENKKGRQDSETLMDRDDKPAPGCAFNVIDRSTGTKKSVRLSATCRRDTNPLIDGFLQDLYSKATGTKDRIQLSRFDGLEEAYFTTKLGIKDLFIPVTFLVGDHHKKILGFEGLPTEKDIARALKNPKKYMVYEWTNEKCVDAVAAGKKILNRILGEYVTHSNSRTAMFDQLPEDVASEAKTTVKLAEATRMKAKAARLEAAAKKEKAAKVEAAKVKAAKAKAKAAATKKPATVKKATKKAAAKKVTWYKTSKSNETATKRAVAQPTGFFATKKEAQSNKPKLTV